MPQVLLTLLSLMVFLTVAGSSVFSQNMWGTFTKEPAMRPLPDKKHALWELLEDYSFTDMKKRVWTAKKGLHTDGASIPWQAWTLVGPPMTGPYRLPAVIHDQYCEDNTLAASDDVHEMFYYAMRAAGVGENKAIIMWVAVYAAGPHWRTVRGPDGKEKIEVFYYRLPPGWPEAGIAQGAIRTKDLKATAAFIKEKSQIDWNRERRPPPGPISEDGDLARLKMLFDNQPR